MIVTPRLVRPLNPDEVPPLPTLPGRFLPTGDDIGEQLQGGGGVADAPAQPLAATRRDTAMSCQTQHFASESRRSAAPS